MTVPLKLSTLNMIHTLSLHNVQAFLLDKLMMQQSLFNSFITEAVII